MHADMKIAKTGDGDENEFFKKTMHMQKTYGRRNKVTAESKEK